MIIGLILSVFGIGFLCWLLLTLAVYALPFFAGVTAGLAAYHSGAGVIGAILVGFVAGAATWLLGQLAFATVRSAPLRLLIAALFVAPAVLAGYSAVLGLGQIGVPSPVWREIFAVIGAICIGVTSLVRLLAIPPGTLSETAGLGLTPAPPLIAEPERG